MTDARDRQPELLGLLEQQIATTTTLLGLLKTERETLNTRDIEALSRNGDMKHRCLAELDALDADRRQLSELIGLPADRIGFDDFLNTLDERDPLRIRWQRLVGLLEQCRELNEANGRLVALQRYHVQQALTVLRGADPAAMLYGPDGSPASPSGGLPISSA